MRMPYTRPKQKKYMYRLPPRLAIPAQNVFSNEDLVDTIATFCTQSSLVSLIRLSWTAFVVSKKHLWKVLPSSFHVFILLPFLEFRDGHWTLQAKETRPPPWEWTRFDLYAPYIQQFISIGSSSVLGEHDIDPQMLPHLCFSRPDKFFISPIFPALRTLHVTARDLGNFLPFSIDDLCTDRLEDVEIHSKRSLMEPYLEDLVRRAGNIRKLAVIGRFSKGAFKALRSFRQLRKLTIGVWHANETESRILENELPDFLDGLSTHNKLSHLLIQARVSRPLQFESLRHVQHVEIRDTASSILNILGAGCFRTAVLRFVQAEPRVAYKECFTFLGRNSSRVLESVVVHSHAHAKHNFPVMYCLEPLLGARHIQKVCIYHSERLNIVALDVDIARMMIAWPRLSQLVLSSSPWTVAGRDKRQQPTFISVYSLTKLPLFRAISMRVENISIDVQFPLCIEKIPNFELFPSALRHHLMWISSRKT